eukprot:488398-Hanusia_phi.AAC.1
MNPKFKFAWPPGPVRSAESRVSYTSPVWIPYLSGSVICRQAGALLPRPIDNRSPDLNWARRGPELSRSRLPCGHQAPAAGRPWHVRRSGSEQKGVEGWDGREAVGEASLVDQGE